MEILCQKPLHSTFIPTNEECHIVPLPSIERTKGVSEVITSSADLPEVVLY